MVKNDVIVNEKEGTLGRLHAAAIYGGHKISAGVKVKNETFK